MEGVTDNSIFCLSFNKFNRVLFSQVGCPLIRLDSLLSGCAHDALHKTVPSEFYVPFSRRCKSALRMTIEMHLRHQRTAYYP